MAVLLRPLALAHQPSTQADRRQEVQQVPELLALRTVVVAVPLRVAGVAPLEGRTVAEVRRVAGELPKVAQRQELAMRVAGVALRAAGAAQTGEPVQQGRRVVAGPKQAARCSLPVELLPKAHHHQRRALHQDHQRSH